MPDPVITSVSERLNLSPEVSDQVVRTLAALIKKQVARDGRVRVPGLGTFAQAHGHLVFEPAPALHAAVNASFVGLDPVPISEPPDVAPAESPQGAGEADETVPTVPVPPLPDAPQEPIPVSEGDEVVHAEEPEDATEPPAEELPLAGTETVEEVETVQEHTHMEEPTIGETPDEGADVAEMDQTALEPPAMESSIRDHSEPDEQDEPMAPVVAEGRAEDEEAEESVPVAAAEDPDARYRPPSPRERRTDLPPSPPPARTVPPARRAADEEQQRSMMPWVILVALVLLAVPAAFYYFVYMRAPGETVATAPPETEMQASTPEAETAPPADAITEPTGEGDEVAPEGLPEEQEDIVPAEPEPEGTAPAVDEDVALRFVPEDGGYTIYVASVPSQDQAERIAAQYRSRLSGQLVPVGIVRADTDAGTRYRVAVGQVSSLDEALGLKERLADLLPADAWARRVEPDN